MSIPADYVHDGFQSANYFFNKYITHELARLASALQSLPNAACGL